MNIVHYRHSISGNHDVASIITTIISLAKNTIVEEVGVFHLGWAKWSRETQFLVVFLQMHESRLTLPKQGSGQFCCYRKVVLDYERLNNMEWRILFNSIMETSVATLWHLLPCQMPFSLCQMSYIVEGEGCFKVVMPNGSKSDGNTNHKEKHELIAETQIIKRNTNWLQKHKS